MNILLSNIFIELRMTSQRKIGMNSSAYRSYSKAENTNIIMNKILVDSGYPQDIFLKNISHKSQDFIEDNKKNLKNFFKERLPSKQITKDNLKVKPIMFDPLKIFEFKRQQFYLKNQTKIVLDDTFVEQRIKVMRGQTKKMGKVQEIFFINDKTLEFRKKFQSLNVPRFDSYSKNNYRRGTQSFMEKRSGLLKRQAYERVFGPDISSISRTLPVTLSISENQSLQKSKKVKNNTKRNPRVDKSETKKEDLSKLIQKIDEFKNKIKPVKLDYHQQSYERFQASNNRNLQESDSINGGKVKIQGDQVDKQNVLSLIEKITDVYKGQAIECNRARIGELEDLEKLDAGFYKELNRHKKSRMEKRMHEIYKYIVPESNELINTKLNAENHERNIFEQRNKIKRPPSDILSITDDGNQEEQFFTLDIKPQKRRTVHQRFRYLGTQLIKAYLQASFYMVSPNNFYPAFWEEKKPFQMEGSYAFFKAIKLNDIECLKSFLKVDFNFLYQKDMNGRTPLIYSCLHNQNKIAAYFLELGSNVDKICDRKKTALFYALQNKNLQMVCLLFQYGANPWSTSDCPYQQQLKQLRKENQLYFHTVFSNAKKIYLAVRLQLGSKKRRQFWHQNKTKINYRQIIGF